jgi:hypothetical protein
LLAPQKVAKNEKTRASVGKASFKSGGRFLKKSHLESASNFASPLVSWPISMLNQDTTPLNQQEGNNDVGTTALVIVGSISTTVIADGGAPAPKQEIEAKIENLERQGLVIAEVLQSHQQL